MASLKERIAKAKAAAEAAEAVISEQAFLDEEAERKELAELEAREQEARDRKRSADVARRIDVWRDKLGEGVEIVAVSISAKPHDFIVAAGGTPAYRAWQKGLRDVAIARVQKGRQKVDADEVDRVYAVAGILDWNGQIVDERAGDAVSSEIGKKLNDL